MKYMNQCGLRLRRISILKVGYYQSTSQEGSEAERLLIIPIKINELKESINIHTHWYVICIILMVIMMMMMMKMMTTMRIYSDSELLLCRSWEWSGLGLQGSAERGCSSQ